MHDAALALGRLFFETLCGAFMGGAIADLGAMNVNGSLRTVAPAGFSHVGIDMAPGPGVDKFRGAKYRCLRTSDTCSAAPGGWQSQPLGRRPRG